MPLKRRIMCLACGRTHVCGAMRYLPHLLTLKSSKVSGSAEGEQKQKSSTSGSTCRSH
jgi:hypothetical protein